MNSDVYLVWLHSIKGDWTPFAITKTEDDGRALAASVICDPKSAAMGGMAIGHRVEKMPATKAIELLLKGAP